MHRDSIKYAVILAVLLATTVVSVYGFSTFEIPHRDKNILAIVLSALCLAALTFFTRRSPIVLGAGLIACVSIACGHAWPIIVVAVFGLSSTVLGRCILGHRISASWPTHLLIGAGAFGTFTGLAAYYTINYSWLYSAMLLLALLLGSKHTASIYHELLIRIRTARSSGTVTCTTLDILISSFACLYVLIAFMPEIGHDALAMHLFVPSHMAQQHKWGFDAQNYVWAVMPMLADWIYSIVYMLADETASRLINSAFILLVAWQVREMVIWAGGTATSSRWAMLIFLSTPLAFAENSSLHIEGVWTAFVMAGTLAILKVSSSTPDARERLSHLLLAGVMLGFSLAAKAVTLSVLPVLLVILLSQYKAWAIPGVIRTILLGSVCLILAGAIPYVSAWYLTGNPVFPFFNAIFQSPFWPSQNFDPSATFGTGVSWDTLYRMVFNSNRYIEGKIGAAGFQWLLLPTAAVALVLSGNRNALRILLIGAGALIMTFQSTAYLRYIFPSFALLSVVLVLPFSDTKIFPKTAGIIAGILLITSNMWFLQAATYYGQLVPSALLSATGRDAYLSERLPVRKIVDIVNALNTEHRRVAVFASPLTAGLNSDALYASWYNVKWKAEFDAAITESQLAQLLLSRQVDWLIIDSSQLPEVQLNRLLKVSSPVATLTGIELRKFNDAYRYSQERLLNTELSNLDGWTLTSPSSYDGARKILTVSVSTPAIQAVEVTPGQSFKNSVLARCSTAPAPGRIQVNWMDAKGSFIRASIETFDCKTEWTTHEMTVVAPPNAHSAVIYASGHTETPLEFKSLSFRQ